MSAQVVETDTFPTAIVSPMPDDGTYPETVPQAFSDLASRTRYLDNILDKTGPGTVEYIADANVDALPAAAGTYVPVESRAAVLSGMYKTLLGRIKNVAALANAIPGAVSNTWNFIPTLAGCDDGEWAGISGVTSPPYIVQQVLGASDAQIAIPFTIPNNAVINSVTALCRSPLSHGGSLTGMTMPRLRLYKGAVGGSGNPAITLLGEATDSSPTAANYESQHNISILNINHTVSIPATSWYFLNLRGEDGGNAAAPSFRVWLISINFLTPAP